MATEQEIRKITDEIINHGTTWLKNAKSTLDAVPFVERTLCLCQEIKTTFDTYPGGLPPERLDPIRDGLEHGKNFIGSWVNGKQADSIPQAISGSALVSAAGTHVTGLLGENISNGNTSICVWANEHLHALELIQADEANRNFIEFKLRSLYPGGEQVFKESIIIYRQVKEGIGSPTSAGIAFRNVLEAILWSRLLQLARTYTANQSIKKWPDMAAAVARGGRGSPQAIQLAAQEAIYDDLWKTKLTRIAKGYIRPTVPDWEAIYAQFIGFLYTTLALVDFKDGI